MPDSFAYLSQLGQINIFNPNPLTKKQRISQGQAEREHCNFNNKARKTMCSEAETKQQQRLDMKWSSITIVPQHKLLNLNPTKKSKIIRT